MNTTAIVAVIGAVVPLIVAITGLVAALRAHGRINDIEAAQQPDHTNITQPDKEEASNG